MKKNHRLPVAVVLGTRPEAIKLAPVILALRRSRRLRPVVVATAQHKQMLRQTLGNFGLESDVDLDVMKPRQTLWELSARLSQRLGRYLEAERPAAILVQGDTTSAFFGALTAFYHQIPVGHVEAGLRSGNPYSPFPEELNRSLIGRVARWHFAPTALAVSRLRAEGIERRSIHNVGNTVVDALRHMARRPDAAAVARLAGPLRGKRLVLVTCHRRENLGAPMIGIAKAIHRLAVRHPRDVFLFPVHPNPRVRDAMLPILSNLPNVRLAEPLDYPAFLACLRKAHLVLTDSGGVQEEATALGKPALVLRTETERPEGVDAGALRLVGTNPARIVREAAHILDDARVHRAMSRASRVFGDGHSSERIVRLLEKSL